MPDGKRNPLPPEGETEGVHCYYDDELQNATGLRRKVPLNQNPRSFTNLSDRLLKTMVANEIKNTLNGEDNKKLVAHHRPVLHSESDAESEMVVVGVVLNPKLAQNEEVSKALEMLRRNGVRCVNFTLKDSSQNGDKTDDASVEPCENGNSPSTEELLKTLIAQQVNENTSPCADPNELSPAPKKVSSPTVSTTSYYASPPPSKETTTNDDDVILNLESDTSCTSTTSPGLNVATITEDSGPVRKTSSPVKMKRETKRRNAKKAQAEAQVELPPTLSPSPPILFPQISDTQTPKPTEDHTGIGNEKEDETKALSIKVKSGADETALRRKKRRKRLYPYVSRRRPRNKRKKVVPIIIESLDAPKPSLPPPQIRPISPAHIFQEPISDDKPIALATQATASMKIDPYEFEDSDIDGATYDSFKTPAGRGVPVSRKRGSKSTASTVPSPKKRSSKRSPRKRLTFPKSRAISPDITDHGGNATRRQQVDSSKKAAGDSVDNNSNDACTTLESCVQPISTSTTARTTALALPPTNILPDVKLVLPQNDDNRQCESLQPSNCNDESPEANLVDASGSEGKHADPCVTQQATTARIAEESVEQTKSIAKVGELESKPRPRVNVPEFVVPAPPDDSLHDAPESMQLRRSSFYSSISRNVRTNLEKYLDGRPPDLKPVKRSKKIKNGFLLHHGDNFPEDPEAPYRLHLATQVLLKLNKRRSKCKPKEDKGKSLLSYLKLQPKRVSRVGKNSKASSEVCEASATNETTSVFSGEWTVPRKYVCNICGQVENAFWDMVMHKGEVHPGIVVTHVELNEDPPEGFRRPPSPRISTTLPIPPPCTKCESKFTTYPDLHRHIFECAGNAAVLDEGINSKVAAKKKKGKRKRGFNKRRISSMPKKNASKNSTNSATKSGEITKRRNSEVFKCEFCTREFKTEGWLKNHVSLSHSLPISIPLNKLSLPTRASFSSSRRFAAQVAKPTKQLGRES